MPFYYEPSYVLASGIVFIIVCPIVTCLRFIVRLRANKNTSLGADDWLTVPATVLVVCCAAIVITGVQLKILGYPTPDPDPSEYYFSTIQKLQWPFLLMQTLGIGLTKLSFVMFYRRIFCVGSWKSPFELASAIVGICVLCWIIAFFLWTMFSCPTDFTARWTNPTRFNEVCKTETQSAVGLVISDFITDVAVVALPIVPVMKLHLRWRSKLLVLAVFAIGLIAVAVSTLRMVFLIETAFALTGGINNAFIATTDNDLSLTEVFYWSMIEAGLALIACCLPTLNNLFTLPSVRSFVASLRSLRSIGSGRSSVRNRDAERGQMANPTGYPLPHKPSRSFSARQGSTATASHDLKLMPGSSGLNSGDASTRMEIRVDHTIEQTSSPV